jgi:hypothetical protein
MRGDTGPAFGQAHRMILTEYGLHFAKDGDHWRCVEWPALTMLPGDRYEVDGQGFNSLAGAIGRARRRAPTLSNHRDPFVIHQEPRARVRL